MRVERVKIKTPTPHSKQSSFVDSKAKRKVVVSGRRSGKTTGVSILASDAALDGRRVLEAAPTADQTNAFWDACKKYFVDAIHKGYVAKNETDRTIDFPSGGRIKCKTAHDADSLRGDYADLLILDEYSLMKPSAWDEVGAPMLLDNDGDAVFIFTPKRKNHAHAKYVQAMSDDTGRWAAWHFTSFDNPYLSKVALDEITHDMSEDAYRQEILAEFLDSEGAVFRNISACMNAKTATPSEHYGHMILAGIDWGKQRDYTAISLCCLSCHKEVVHDRFNQIDYIVQQGRIEALVSAWRCSAILAESNAMGVPIIEQLQRSGLPVIGFETTAQTKPPLIENLALSLERAEWQFISDAIWTAELEAYERTVSQNTGRSSYSAPEGVHDDTVMARALAVFAANLAMDLPRREIIYNPVRI